MKYRLLSAEEQKIFDQDFKYFLISNGVTNEEWLEMNESKPEKALVLVELFSDAVLDIVYKKIEFIEFREKNSCLVFRCLENKMELISILPKEPGTVDLSTVESIHEALSKKANQLTVFATEKPYAKTREEEIHQMVEQGCVNSSSEFWEALQMVLNSKK